MKVIHLELKTPSGHLLMRKNLTSLKDEIIESIGNNPSGSIFYYDFSKIQGINTSAIDELIAKVIKHIISNVEDKYLILINLQEPYEHRFNIDNSLEQLDVGIIEMLPDGNAEFLGKISDTHKELLEIIYKNKSTTAREIVDSTGKKLSLVSTHLNRLYTLRLIMRREELLIDGGRQFVYQSLF
jgi:hypothetical protein